MHFIISIFLFALLSFAAFSEQGTWSTDDTETSEADASLSGTQDEEVQLIEKEEYDPMEDPIVIEPDGDKNDKNREEVEEATP